MTTFLTALTLVLLLAGLWLLLEHGRRHAQGMPHLPLGDDPSRDSDLSRVLHDLDVGPRCT